MEEEISDIYKKGIEAYRRGELEHAGDLLVQVVEAKEDDHRAWNALGVIFTKTKRFEDADICFENAITLDPFNEIYERNRMKNKKHMKKGLNDYFSPGRFPESLPVKPVYLFGAIAGIFLFAVFFFIIIPFLFPAPISTTVGDIPIEIKQDGDLVFIKNTGGPGTNQVHNFELTANNKTVYSLDGTPRILGIDMGSTLAIPIEDLRTIAPDNVVTFRITAFFSDETNKLVKTETVTLPELIPEDVEPTPTPFQYSPRLKQGEIIQKKENNVYYVISAILPENQYQIRPLSRRNDGLFIVQQESSNVSMMDFEKEITNTELYLQMKSPVSGLPLQAVRNSSSPVSTDYPLYIPGDIISGGSGQIDEAVVVLGYDAGTDEYATDTLTKYSTGEWGYRTDAISDWKLRKEVEQMYPSRIDRIALSRIGIGSDSSPPGTAPLYSEGDIIAKDRGADTDQLLVLSYNQNATSYDTDVIYRTFDGNWERGGAIVPIMRSTLEKQYPYKVRNVDISLVTINPR